MKAKFDVPFTKEELEKEFHRKNLFGYIMMIDTLFKVMCEDADCIKSADFLSQEMTAIETKRRAYVKARIDLMRPRLSSLFSEMAEDESFKTLDIDEFTRALYE